MQPQGEREPQGRGSPGADAQREAVLSPELCLCLSPQLRSSSAETTCSARLTPPWGRGRWLAESWDNFTVHIIFSFSQGSKSCIPVQSLKRAVSYILPSHLVIRTRRTGGFSKLQCSGKSSPLARKQNSFTKSCKAHNALNTHYLTLCRRSVNPRVIPSGPETQVTV